MRFRPSAQHDRDRHRPRPRNERTAASIQWGTNGHPIGRGRGRGSKEEEEEEGKEAGGRAATRTGSRMKVSKGGGEEESLYNVPRKEREQIYLLEGKRLGDQEMGRCSIASSTDVRRRGGFGKRGVRYCRAEGRKEGKKRPIIVGTDRGLLVDRKGNNEGRRFRKGLLLAPRSALTLRLFCLKSLSQKKRRNPTRKGRNRDQFILDSPLTKGILRFSANHKSPLYCSSTSCSTGNINVTAGSM